jgi:hypothetical protein
MSYFLMAKMFEGQRMCLIDGRLQARSETANGQHSLHAADVVAAFLNPLRRHANNRALFVSLPQDR